jgi:putative DNA primase/helicase
MSISYSHGTGTKDSKPKPRQAPDFDGFVAQILAIPRARSKETSGYICGPMRPNGGGELHRCKADLLPRWWLAQDLDGGHRDEVEILLMRLADYEAVAWTTARHTPECPRLRIVLALNREIDGPQGERLGAAFVCVVGAGLLSLKWDSSTHRGEQACFLPMQGAEIMRYHGDPIDVDAVLALAPGEPSRERPETPDPYRTLIITRGLFLRELGPGKDAIICPFAAAHSEQTSDSATVYFRPHHNGHKWGKIHCLHSHCADREDNDFIRALGAEPRQVWRRQTGGKTPYDDLPPVEAYDEDARRHAGGNSRAEHGEDTSGNEKDAGRADGGEILYRCMDDIEEMPIRWLWRGRIARGKITNGGRKPRLGKIPSAGQHGGHRHHRRVVAGGPVEVRAGIRNRLKRRGRSRGHNPSPRLRAAGADLKRIFILDAIQEPDKTKRLFNLTADIERLGDLAKKLGDVALIDIDPITAYLGRVDSHKNAEVRGVLAPLAAMAAEIKAAIVCVNHLNKAGGPEALLRVMGSLAFVAAGRSGYLVCKDPDDETRRLFLPLKNNIAAPRPGLAFQIKARDLGDGIDTSCVEWDTELVTMTADEAMAPPEEPEERGAMGEAVRWLGELLKDGSVDSKEIFSDAKQAGIAWRTVERAKARLGVKATKASYAGGWRWTLP